MTNFITQEGFYRLLIAWVIISALGFMFRRQFANLTKPVLLGALFRLLTAWVVLSITGLFLGSQFLSLCLPYLTRIINLIQNDYSATLSIAGQDGKQIHLLATMNHDIPPFVKGDKLENLIDTMAMDFIPPLVLLFSLLFAWPARRLQARFKILLLGIPLGLMVMTLTVPFQLSGTNEKVFQYFAHHYHTPREKPFSLTWLQFFENGGAWARSIGMAILGVALSQRIGQHPTTKS